ncbi:MAG: hypothetical protein HC876_18920 [Chloroflexaceae bacterium]|nr:hypothetical protein [Chloroflexaceae bacterium]
MAYDRSASIALLQPEELPPAHGPVAVFQRWAAALPNPTHPVYPAFCTANKATLERVAPLFMVIVGFFYALFFLVDPILYPEVTGQMWMLRVLLVGILLMTAAVSYWYSNRISVEIVMASGVLVGWLIITLMLIVNRHPLGLYGTPFFAGIILFCLLPFTRTLPNLCRVGCGLFQRGSA